MGVRGSWDASWLDRGKATGRHAGELKPPADTYDNEVSHKVRTDAAIQRDIKETI